MLAAPALATGAVATTQQPAARGGEDRTRVETGELVIRRLRTDRLRLTRDNRLCIKTTADPVAQAAVNASGERMGDHDLASLSMETAGALSEELHALGHPIYFRDGGLTHRVAAIVQLVTWGDCDRPAPIRIEQMLLRGPTPSGYRVRFSAMQGARAYVAEIQRSRTVTVADSERIALAERATRRFDGSPFWSARGDLIALREDFIKRLLGQ
jgi:hypothetical protein